jgi:adenylosuccinate lyase
MKANLEMLKGLICSEHVMLALVDKGMEKDAAYRAVQSVAMQAWEAGGDCRKMIAANDEVKSRLSAEELAACFDYEKHLKGIETVYQRLGL